jgi:hypothetical protein
MRSLKALHLVGFQSYMCKCAAHVSMGKESGRSNEGFASSAISVKCVNVQHMFP